MGLFSSIFKGMGFEGDKKAQKRTKEGSMKQETNEKYSNFDNGLANSFSVGEFKNPTDIAKTLPNFPGIVGRNLIIYAPKDNNDIKILVECLRRKEACIVNLAQLKSADADKILQFVSGAVYALKGSIKRLQGDLFLMAPEGVNIMTQTK